MITVLTGNNSFEIQEELHRLVNSFDGHAEKIDGTLLELKDIPDLLMGRTLFSEKRLIIIKDLSQNSRVWEKLPEWTPRISDDIQLVLVDEKLDKRLTAYKELKKVADIREFNNWGERDYALAETWTQQRAESLGMKLDKKLVHHIVERVGLDQWQLAQALEKLSLLDAITPGIIESTIDANPAENVFQLFETALEGDRKKVHEMIQTLELTEDPYKLFALLSSQVFQLAAVAYAGEGENPAKDMGIHPYVATKLSRHAKKVGKSGAGRMIKTFAQADADMKLSKADPWLLIEKALATT